MATASGVTFAGGRIDALVRCEGAVLSTREPPETWSRGHPTHPPTLFGVAQVRRRLATKSLSLTHVVFAPASPRALLLGLVRLDNRSAEPLAVEHTEIWDVPRGDWRVANAACERRFGGHLFALAEASAVTRAHAPEAEPSRGLALDVVLALPPRSRRHLAFAYVALPEEEDAGEVVRAWRGGVVAELARIGASGLGVEAYRELGRYPAPR